MNDRCSKIVIPDKGVIFVPQIEDQRRKSFLSAAHVLTEVKLLIEDWIQSIFYSFRTHDFILVPNLDIAIRKSVIIC